MAVFEHTRERIRSSLWFVPGALVILAIAAALILEQVDLTLQRFPDWLRFQVAFTGGPESARSILSTIANSTLSLTALVFSITILVLQLASSQFSPRTLRTFLRDRPSKWALGTFLATFSFALVGLRAVRNSGPGREEFVPALVITGAFLLVLATVFVFIYYIHHVAQRIRVSNIIAGIAGETELLIDRLKRQEEHGRPGPTAELIDSYVVIPSHRSGYVVNIERGAVLRWARKEDAVVELVTGVGGFVAKGDPLLRVHVAGSSDRLHDDEDRKDLMGFVSLDTERTMEQDISYGFRQLVDVAVRAISPGVNDPTTAVNVIDYLYVLLLRLGNETFPSGKVYDDEGELRLVIPVMPWHQYVELALSEIAEYGAHDPQIRVRLLTLLRELIEKVHAGNRDALRDALRRIEDDVDRPRFHAPTPG